MDRCRDGRHSSVNRDVPAFLSFPDGSHSLGVISQHGDVETEARGGSRDSLVLS